MRPGRIGPRAGRRLADALDRVESELRRRSSSRYVSPRPEQRRARILEATGVDLVLDVGANAGQYAEELRESGFRGPIVSFEPVASAFARLENAASADPDWSCRRLALGRRSGSEAINVAANEAKSSSLLPQRKVEFATTATMRYVGREQVELRTLDELADELLSGASRPLLKLDVQGLELDVLRGAERTLARLAAIEAELSLTPLYTGQPAWREVVDHLEQRGFDVVALEPGYSDYETGRLIEMDGIFVRRDLAPPWAAPAAP